MSIEGFIVREEPGVVSVVGFTGADLFCEGCGSKTTEIHETDDSVMLCKPCYDSCLEDDE